MAAVTERGEIVGEALPEPPAERDAADGFLGRTNGEWCVIRDRPGQLAHCRVERQGLDQMRREPERSRLRRVEQPAGEQQLLGARGTDQIDESRAVRG